jgi:hypothetical protein
MPLNPAAAATKASSASLLPGRDADPKKHRATYRPVRVSKWNAGLQSVRSVNHGAGSPGRGGRTSGGPIRGLCLGRA